MHKKNNKWPLQGDLIEAQRPRPAKWDCSHNAVVMAQTGQCPPPLPAPWPRSVPLPALGSARGGDTAPFNGTAHR